LRLIAVHLALAAVAVAAAAAPAVSDAATVTYLCRHDLCTTSLEGGDRRLTRDGRQEPYFALQNVRDSAKVVFSRNPRTYVADARVRRVRPLRGYARLSTDARNVLIFAPSTICFARVGARRADRCATGSVAFPLWWRSRRVYGQTPHRSLADPQDGVCLLRADLTCRRVVARAARGGSLREFDVSADGRWVVAAEYPPTNGSVTRLALFDARTGRRVRTLTRPSHDHLPSFSPDGRHIVFERNRREVPAQAGAYDTALVAVVPRSGGRVRVLARGANPVWTR
jgi:hypothetical protein